MKKKQHTWAEMIKVADKSRVQKFIASWCEVAYRGMKLNVVGFPKNIVFRLYALPYKKNNKQYGVAHFLEGDINKQWLLKKLVPVKESEKQKIVDAFFDVRKRNTICRPPKIERAICFYKRSYL